MAKYLMTWMILVLCIRQPLAEAEVLRDPTMPATQSGLIQVGQFPQVPASLILQSITLGTTAKYAMINGKTVMLGKAYEEWVLIKLTANEATLRGKDGSTKVLAMDYPLKKISQANGGSHKAISASGLSSFTHSNNDHLTESLRAPLQTQAENQRVKQ